MKKILAMLMSLLLLLPLAASAVKLYKWVDKDGKVTYQELPPPADASKVEEKNINPDANVIQAEHPAPNTSTSSGSASNSNNGPVPADDSSTTRQTTVPAPVLQEGDVSGSQAANPLPAIAPPAAVAPPGPVAPPPVQPPPPVLPPPAALPPPPPPPPRGAH